MFQHTAARRRLPYSTYHKNYGRCFNTQPPVGGCIYTDLEIAERWKNDIQVAEKCVNQYGNGRNLPQSVFDAATSITFNVGCGAMRKSTMFKYLNAGKYEQACNELSRWTKAGGKTLPGLVSRREKEKALCLTDLSKQ